MMPSDKRQALKAYAQYIDAIRTFFSDRDVVEVHTPRLGASTIPGPAIESFSVADGEQTYFLQTSPEFYMKRLLADGSGDIYQLSKVFRREELGRFHQPEFTMLEWYRVGFNDDQLIQEIDAFLQHMLSTSPAIQMNYHDLFSQLLDVDIDTISLQQLLDLAENNTRAEVTDEWEFDEVLDLLFCDCIEPFLKQQPQPVFVRNFPQSKAALSRLVERNGRKVAARFELFYKGLELANGFYELTDPATQRQRFRKDNEIRQKNNQSTIDLDEKFIQSLSKLPECSGVALGVDRLIMLAMESSTLQDVLNFPIQ